MDIFNELNQIVRKAFDDDEIQLTPETTADDVEGWDSLSHTNLVTMIERHFQISFKSIEIMKWKNVGQMAESIKMKLEQKA
jgi:acyl carrier protein